MITLNVHNLIGTMVIVGNTEQVTTEVQAQVTAAILQAVESVQSRIRDKQVSSPGKYPPPPPSHQSQG